MTLRRTTAQELLKQCIKFIAGHSQSPCSCHHSVSRWLTKQADQSVSKTCWTLRMIVSASTHGGSPARNCRGSFGEQTHRLVRGAELVDERVVAREQLRLHQLHGEARWVADKSLLAVTERIPECCWHQASRASPNARAANQFPQMVRSHFLFQQDAPR